MFSDLDLIHFVVGSYMGTAESWPELIEHLGKGPTQPWEHR